MGEKKELYRSDSARLINFFTPKLPPKAEIPFTKSLPSQKIHKVFEYTTDWKNITDACLKW
jgi:hypothetical protein